MYFHAKRLTYNVSHSLCVNLHYGEYVTFESYVCILEYVIHRTFCVIRYKLNYKKFL